MSNSSSMTDIAGLAGTSNDYIVKNSTSRKGNTELNMEDFLQLMIVQLQSQTIDDTMDTSEMMNQMVQMQMVTAITNMTEASVMGYAASLVGKVVTIGILNDDFTLEEREIEVMGTGTMDGQQVIFGSDGNTYRLSQVMAIGRLPDENGKYPGVSGATGDSTNKPVEGTESSGEATDKVDGSGETGETTGTEGAAAGGNTTENPEYNGEQGAPTD